MSKKTLRAQSNKMLVAALFTMLAVGIYAHVDSWVTRTEISNNVLGRETSATATTNPATGENFFQTMWCRLRYGKSCDTMKTAGQTKVGEDNMSTDALIDRELRNLENEMKSDQGADQSSSYWSM